jgi:hypothetical protein
MALYKLYHKRNIHPWLDRSLQNALWRSVFDSYGGTVGNDVFYAVRAEDI